MASFSMVCPFCDHKVGLQVKGFALTGMAHPALYLFCSSCLMPSVSIVQMIDPAQFSRITSIEGPTSLNPTVGRIIATYPNNNTAKAPAHLPEEVERVFLQARSAHTRGDSDLAAMGYRRTLELALKAIDPDLKGNLGPRVDALAARQKLTPSMKDWAKSVVLLGNEANHDPPEPTAENVEDLFLFVESTLEYLFTLPTRVELRRTRTAGA